MWEIAFYFVGAAAAIVVALHLKGQLAGGGCGSCPCRGSCKKKTACAFGTALPHCKAKQ